MAWQGFSNKTFGAVRNGAARLGMVRFGKVLLEKVCGRVWPGGMRPGLAPFAQVWRGFLTKEN